MDNFIKITDDNGNNYFVEVLDIFNVEGYDKEYILYTSNRDVDKDNIEAYVSILKQENDSFILQNITDEAEWDTVQKAIQEMGDENE